MTRRYALTAAQWRKIEALVPGKAGDHGRTVADHRLFVNSVMWVRRSGAHWKHLPEQYGHGKSVPKRLPLGQGGGVGADLGHADGSPKAPIGNACLNDRPRASAIGHRQGGHKDEAVGRSRGGLTTNIHMATDAQGRPVRFMLTGGQTHDVTQAPALVRGWRPSHVIADKGYDSQAFVEGIKESGAIAVIPPRSNCKNPRAYDAEVYKQRDRIE
jgi:transposase